MFKNQLKVSILVQLNLKSGHKNNENTYFPKSLQECDVKIINWCPSFIRLMCRLFPKY